MALPAGVIHLYLGYPDEISDTGLLHEYECLLSDEEKNRYQRLGSAYQRHQFLLTRALIRTTLSRYVNKHPRDWRFVNNRYGKPEILRRADEPAIRFNLSHSKGLIVCAIALHDDLGVDVEYTQRNNALLAIARRFFSPMEVTQLQKMTGNAQRQYFFELWTLKEAYIKACGKGMAIPLRQFSFDISDKNKTVIRIEPCLQDRPEHWRFWRLAFSENHVAAIAVKSTSVLNYRLVIRKTVPLLQNDLWEE